MKAEGELVSVDGGACSEYERGWEAGWDAASAAWMRHIQSGEQAGEN